MSIIVVKICLNTLKCNFIGVKYHEIFYKQKRSHSMDYVNLSLNGHKGLNGFPNSRERDRDGQANPIFIQDFTFKPSPNGLLLIWVFLIAIHLT